MGTTIGPDARPGRVLTFANQKGGSGKSLAAYFFADILAERGERVLVVDCDGQEGNLSGDLGADKSPEAPSLAGLLQAMISRTSPDPVAYVQRLEFCDLLAGTDALASVDRQLSANSAFGRETFLRRALDPLAGSYDRVIVDTPGDFDTLSLNALVATEDVIVPCHADGSGIRGAATIVEMCEGVRAAYNPALRVSGLFLNDYSRQSTVHRDMADAIASFCASKGVRMFDTRVCHSTNAGKLTTYGMRSEGLVTGTVRRGLVRDMNWLVDEWLGGAGKAGA